MTTDKKSIVYVNFAPYENAGHILEYLLDTYTHVFLFSFNFHKLTHKNEPSLLTIFKNKKILLQSRLFYLSVPQVFAVILIPIRSLIILLQLLYFGFILKQKYGHIDSYLTVNAFTAWCGNILKLLGVVSETTFWVWDYYPPKHPSSVTVFMRWLYWQFDIQATIHSSRVIYLHTLLYELRKKNGLSVTNTPTVIGIGTHPRRTIQHIKNNPVKLVFLGVIKKTQGLDVICNSARALQQHFPQIELHILGSGPDEDYFKKRAAILPIKIVFYGYTSEQKVDEIIAKSHIGLALYTSDSSNVSSYTDPSKIKRYLEHGIPVLCTNVTSFSRVIHTSQSGIVVSYESTALIKGIKTLMRQFKLYSQNALHLAKKFEYRRMYKSLLTTNEKRF